MACEDIFGECRCYADVNSYDYLEKQKCGILKNEYVIPCDPECCSGGCPGQDKNASPRQPHGFGRLNFPYEINRIFILAIIFTILLVLLTSYTIHKK